MDIRGGVGAINDGAQVEQWLCSGQSNQDWTFKEVATGQYQLIARSSNKCMEVTGGSTAVGAQQQQMTCTSQPRQLWQAHGVGGGKYELRNVNSNLCLGIVGGSVADGAFTEQSNCNLGNSQLWTFGAGTTPPPPTEPAPFGQNASLYKLTFADEFENGFNSAVWNNRIFYDTTSANPINYTVENGALKIWPMLNSAGKYFDRTIDTDGKYTQTYGYFEIEAKLPIGAGTWPAFWLFNHIGARRPEIDIMEAYAGGADPWGSTVNGQRHPTQYGVTIWREGSVDLGRDQIGMAKIPTADLSAAFHKYALKWEPNGFTAYFDGQQVYTVGGSMPDPMYLMLDLWFGGTSGTPSTTNTGMQGKANSYEIRYIRAWQFK